MLFKTFLKKHLLMLLIPILLISVNSCYDDYGLSTSDYDVVVTYFTDDAKFGQYKTYAIADTVFHITEDGEDSPLLSREFDDDIIQRIESNMLAMNYQKEDDPQNNIPDVVIVAAANANRNFNIWTWYPGYGYPGWGWWGGWYYPTTSITAYDVGTLLFFMIDTDEYDEENERYGGVWIAGINGILSRSNASVSRLNSHIDQAFTQSQYLMPNE
jgi:hypothetical protein